MSKPSYYHAFYAQLDGVGCTLSAEDSPFPTPAEPSFATTFPFDHEGREVAFEHIGTWDHRPSEDELDVAKIAHGFEVEDFDASSTLDALGTPNA
ncbi:MAG: hypothetical protein JWO62_3348 [Acidimicrobiaceae bacterium]|nr:hypothetical protein [Acidimicrobiaceae bacterium]